MSNNDLEATICKDDQSMKQFKPGDIAWIKNRNSCWWPGQVVDEGSVRFKPKKKVKDGVLVRMYGCYEYLYMDPVKCSTEFEKMRKQENLSIREAFKKAMDEDLSRVRSAGKSKRKVSESRVEMGATEKQKEPRAKATRSKKLKQQDVEEPTQTKSPCTTKSSAPEELTPNLSERRMRVMQSLGLIAPLGSPYRRNGFVITASLQ